MSGMFRNLATGLGVNNSDVGTQIDCESNRARRNAVVYDSSTGIVHIPSDKTPNEAIQNIYWVDSGAEDYPGVSNVLPEPRERQLSQTESLINDLIDSLLSDDEITSLLDEIDRDDCQNASSVLQLEDQQSEPKQMASESFQLNQYQSRHSDLLVESRNRANSVFGKPPENHTSNTSIPAEVVEQSENELDAIQAKNTKSNSVIPEQIQNTPNLTATSQQETTSPSHRRYQSQVSQLTEPTSNNVSANSPDPVVENEHSHEDQTSEGFVTSNVSSSRADSNKQSKVRSPASLRNVSDSRKVESRQAIGQAFVELAAGKSGHSVTISLKDYLVFLNNTPGMGSYDYITNVDGKNEVIRSRKEDDKTKTVAFGCDSNKRLTMTLKGKSISRMAAWAVSKQSHGVFEASQEDNDTVLVVKLSQAGIRKLFDLNPNDPPLPSESEFIDTKIKDVQITSQGIQLTKA